MKEMKILSGKHECSKQFDMRIVDVKDDNQEISAWIIYGICKRCNVVMIIDLLLQKEEPREGVDFIIDYELKSGKGKTFKNKN